MMFRIGHNGGCGDNNAKFVTMCSSSHSLTRNASMQRRLHG